MYADGEIAPFAKTSRVATGLLSFERARKLRCLKEEKDLAVLSAITHEVVGLWGQCWRASRSAGDRVRAEHVGIEQHAPEACECSPRCAESNQPLHTRTRIPHAREHNLFPCLYYISRASWTRYALDADSAREEIRDIVHEIVTEASHDAAFHRIDDPAINLQRVAVIEAPLPQSLGPASATAEPVRFRSYEADRILLDVTAESPGLLILSELYYPGWRATVNGKSTAIHKVDGALRGIVVPRGESRVAVEYAPLSFYAGGALSLLTFTGVLAGCVLSLRRKFREA